MRIVRSQIPESVCKIDPAWRRDWAAEQETNFTATVDAGDIDIEAPSYEPQPPQRSAEVVIDVIDKHFRSSIGLPHDCPVSYKGKFRHGSANSGTASKSALSNRLSHFDAIRSDVLPEAYDKSQVNWYFVSTHPTTLWFAGNFLSLFPVVVEEKPTQGLVRVNHLMLHAQTLFKASREFTADTIVKAGLGSVHRARLTTPECMDSKTFLRVIPEKW